MKTDFEEWAKTQDPAFIRDVFSAAAAFQAAQQSEREKYAELIAAAEAVIETAKRHRNVGYADRQMVDLQAVVERFKNEN